MYICMYSRVLFTAVPCRSVPPVLFLGMGAGVGHCAGRGIISMNAERPFVGVCLVCVFCICVAFVLSQDVQA